MTEYVVVYPYPVDCPTKRIPLILKDKPLYLKGMLNLPGGKLDTGERVIGAAVRELKEETGLEEIQEYDPMCYCPPEKLGVIQGANGGKEFTIYCVRVPISSRQDLNPRLTEIENVDWYDLPGLLNLPNLMPNLRLVIPLMEKGVSGWVIQDFNDNWRDTAYHKIVLTFNGIEDNPLKISVRSCAYYLLEEEE